MAQPFQPFVKQVIDSTNVANGTPVKLTGNTTVGNTLILVVRTLNISPAAFVSDSQGNRWVLDATSSATGISISVYHAYLTAALSTNDTIAVQATTAPNFQVYEYTGLINTVQDKSIAASATSGTSLSTGSTANLDGSYEMAFTAVVAGNVETFTAPLGFSPHLPPTSAGIDAADQLIRTKGTISATWNWNTSATNAVAMVVYRLQPPTVNFQNSRIDAGLGALNPSTSQLVRTSQGSLYSTIITSGDIRVYKSIDNGSLWTEQDYRNVPPTGGSLISITIDGSDVIHIAYIRPDSNAGYTTFNTTTDGFGRPEKVFTVSVSSIGGLSISVDSNNSPHILLVNSGGSDSLRYTNRLPAVASPFWKPDINIASAVNGYSTLDLRIDQNNFPQFSVIDLNSGILTGIGNKNDASSFTTTTVTSSFTNAGSASIVIDSVGNTWLGYQGKNNDRVLLAKHVSTDAWATWQTPITDGFNGKAISLVADATDIYIFYERNAGGIAYDRYDSINTKWLGEQIIQPTTSPQTTNFRPHNPSVKWSYYFNNGDTHANNTSQQKIEYLFDDGSTVYYASLNTVQLATNLTNISFASGAGATTTSTSSTSSSTSTSTSISTSSTSTSTSISTSSTSSSTSISTSSTSTSFSTSSTSTSTSFSTSSTSTSTSTSVSTSSTSQSTSTSVSTSSTSTSTSISTSSTSTSVSTSSTSSSTSFSTSSTSTSVSTSTSFSTSSTSTSTSVSTSTSSTSTSFSTSSTSSSTSISTSTSFSTSSTSTSTSVSTSTSSTSTSISTSSTSTSVSTSSTSSSISTSSTSSSTSRSTSTSSTSSSTSTSFSTSSTSSSTSLSTSSTSSSISTSSTSSSVSTSTSISTSSTSTSTTQSFTTSTSSTSSSISTSSTSTSTSFSTSSTSSSVSTSSTSTSRSTSTSSTSTSFSTSSTSTSTSLSTSSTSSSISTSSTSSSTSTTFSTSSTSVSSSTSLSTSSTSTSTSTSISTSSTSTSFSNSSSTSTSATTLTTTSTSSTSTSTSSTSQSTSTSTTAIDIAMIPRVTIRPDIRRTRIINDHVRTKIKVRLN